LNKESVYAAKKNNAQLYADKHFRRDALQGLERCAGEVVSEMLQLIEHADPEEAQMKLLMTGSAHHSPSSSSLHLLSLPALEFPAFADLYQQMKAADPIFAKQCNRSWLLYLQGPPNRPTKDPYGLLQVLLFCRPSLVTPSLSRSSFTSSRDAKVLIVLVYSMSSEHMTNLISMTRQKILFLKMNKMVTAPSSPLPKGTWVWSVCLVNGKYNKVESSVA
jgi:hypothetical protein